MKKSKILIPVLTIAGLGATIAPIAAMTSCSCGDPTPVVEPFTILSNVYSPFYSTSKIVGELKADTLYKVNINVENSGIINRFGIGPFITTESGKDPEPSVGSKFTELKVFRNNVDVTSTTLKEISSTQPIAYFDDSLVDSPLQIQFKLSKTISASTADPLMLYLNQYQSWKEDLKYDENGYFKSEPDGNPKKAGCECSFTFEATDEAGKKINDLMFCPANDILTPKTTEENCGFINVKVFKIEEDGTETDVTEQYEPESVVNKFEINFKTQITFKAHVTFVLAAGVNDEAGIVTIARQK